ncbi:hypothetical protein [Streptomyces sp. NPDC015345]|uniref:hypothetical protein n=1 Tax=Streptomyces sp. NPDC015345 TaxID=3364953 RepID=UPI003701FB1E
MTSIDRTPSPPPESRPDRLAWAIIVTACLSIVAVVVLALTAHPEAATAVAAIGTAVAGLQVTARNRP